MEPELPEREQAHLAAYADGSLPHARRCELEARLAASGALREALERQRVALASVRAVEELAPQRLRAWLRGEDARRPAPRRVVAGPGRGFGEGAFAAVLGRRRPLRAMGATVVMAAVAATALLVNGAGAPVDDLAAAAAGAPSGPAPGRAGPRRLTATSDGIAFPDWAPSMGWRAAGVREDEVEGRRVVTVTYQRDGREVAYAIAARPALGLPAGGGAYRAFEHEGRPAVAWIRGGRTCLLLGGEDVPGATLRRLARSVGFY